MVKRFVDLSIRTKLLLSFGVLIAFLGVVIVIALVGMRAIYTTQKTFQEVYLANALDLLRLESNLNENRVSLLLMVSVQEPSVRNSLHQEIMAVSGHNDEIISRLRARNAHDPELSRRLEELDQIRRDFNTIRDQQTIPLILEGRIEAAETLIASIQTERYLQVRTAANELSRAATDEARAAVERSVRRMNNTVLIFIVIGILVLVVSVAMAVFLTRVIAGPLRGITDAATRIAVGDLDVSVPVRGRGDEVGMVAQVFARMVHSLQEMAKAAEQIADGDLTVSLKPQSANDALRLSFGVMAENLRGLAQEIQEGTRILHTLSTEILKETTQIVADLAEMKATVAEAGAAVRQARQSQQSSQTDDWVDRVEATFERIQRVSASGSTSALRAKATAQELEELGTRLRFFVEKLKV
ncbi:MAG: HAMP domain-containing protein [Thermodesulfobacteriota bacterium]|jgi:methyl-accepting chemotaxis protein